MQPLLKTSAVQADGSETQLPIPSNRSPSSVLMAITPATITTATVDMTKPYSIALDPSLFLMAPLKHCQLDSKNLMQTNPSFKRFIVPRGARTPKRAKEVRTCKRGTQSVASCEECARTRALVCVSVVLVPGGFWSLQ